MVGGARTMSDLQRKWAKAKISAMASADSGFNELDEDGETGALPELPEFVDDDSSSASSASSTGTIVPSPSRNLFARPHGYAITGPFSSLSLSLSLHPSLYLCSASIRAW